MAYEPALIAFIAAGLVGSVAVVMGASADWEIRGELRRATDDWTARTVVRTAEGGPLPDPRLAKEALILAGHGYHPVLQRGGSPPADGRRFLPDPDPAAAVSVTYQRD